jgi:hypothetical protein
VLRRARLVAVFASLLAVCPAAAARAGQRVAPPTGDADGLALLARVHRAYRSVPAVAISGRTGSLSFRFALVLRSGIGIAEQFVASGPSGKTMLVARRGTPTFARNPGSSCWRRLAATDRQSFNNIGLPFPDQPRMQVKHPRRTQTGWLLPIVVDDGPLVFVIDGRSMLIRSFNLSTQGSRIVEQAHNLSSAPTLLVPQPRC